MASTHPHSDRPQPWRGRAVSRPYRLYAIPLHNVQYPRAGGAGLCLTPCAAPPGAERGGEHQPNLGSAGGAGPWWEMCHHGPAPPALYPSIHHNSPRSAPGGAAHGVRHGFAPPALANTTTLAPADTKPTSISPTTSLSQTTSHSPTTPITAYIRKLHEARKKPHPGVRDAARAK